MEQVHFCFLLIQLVINTLSFLPEPSRQVLCLSDLVLKVSDLLSDPLMVHDEALQLVLGLVERDLEHVALLSLLPDLILQLRLLV